MVPFYVISKLKFVTMVKRQMNRHHSIIIDISSNGGLARMLAVTGARAL